MTFEIPQRHTRPFRFEGDALVFWVWSDFEVTEMNSPLIYLRDAQGEGTTTVKLVKRGESIRPESWVEVILPFDSFRSPLYKQTHDPRFDPEDLISVSFVQGLDDDKEHVLLLDDFRILTIAEEDEQAPEAPAGLIASAAERHIDLHWDPKQTDDVLVYRIYRSLNNGPFEPVGDQQGHRSRYADFVGEADLAARYRITAIDLAGNESEPSAIVSAKTRPYSDDELLSMVQEACFRYYWEGAHPEAGLAPEILPGDRSLIALGGNGFGVMALLVAAERQFVSREEAADRMLQIVRFLDRAERFHGVWPHFIDARTGEAIPLFGQYDNGGDLVETAFMIQGLLAARQYFSGESSVEAEIRDTITRFWHEVEWDWYQKTPDSPFLFWHWSPDYGFHISHPLVGWNETLIVYLLAIASPTHPVSPDLYHTGWAGTSDLAVQYRRTWSRTTQGDHFVNGNSYYGIPLEVGCGNGSDLFFTHFSFMGFDPRGIRDRYTNYFTNNRAIARISRAYCIENPRDFTGYGENTWGLSAGVNAGGGRPLPRDDNGTISVMASLASIPYTPAESLAALKHYYRNLGDKIWGIYGFHDGFNESEEWFEEVYMALNQAPITVMIENHRTGLVWQHFMANPEIQPALEAIGFEPDPSGK